MRLFDRIGAGTLWRFAAGVIAVDAVLGLLVLMAPDPPGRATVATEAPAAAPAPAAETRVAIAPAPPRPLPAAPPRETVVAIAEPASPPRPTPPAALAPAVPAPAVPALAAPAPTPAVPPIRTGRREIVVAIRDPELPAPAPAAPLPAPSPAALPPVRTEPEPPPPTAVAEAPPALRPPPGPVVVAIANPDRRPPVLESRRLASVPIRPPAVPRPSFAGFRDGTGEAPAIAVADDRLAPAGAPVRFAEAGDGLVPSRADALVPVPVAVALAETAKPPPSAADALLPEAHVTLLDLAAAPAPDARGDDDFTGRDQLALDDEASSERPAARAEAEAARGRGEALPAAPFPVALAELADPAASRVDALLPASHVVLADPLAAPAPGMVARTELVGSRRLAFDDETRRSALAARSLSDRLDPSGLPRPLRLAGDETRWAPPQGAAVEGGRVELTPSMRPSPAVLLARWLPDRTVVAHSDPLKTRFVRQVLPLVMQVNDHILRLRERAVTLGPEIEAGRILSPAEQRQVDEILEATRLERWDSREMLLRLDAVPLSMALAQAATESGWGTSRPAREDNALFGQMVFPPSAPPQVQAFRDLLETVAAYARNLNTHNAYREFRNRRAALRERGRQLDGHALAAFIERYSERGVVYVEAIRDLMRANNLSALDVEAIEGALLQEPPPVAEPQGIDN